MALTGPVAGSRHPSLVLPRQPPIAKPLSGHLEVAMIGDSICAGVTNGEDPAGDGSDGLNYGGAAVPSGATVRYTTDGATWNAEAVYATSGGGAPINPGYVPHIVAWALSAGYTTIRVSRYGVSGASTPTARATFFDRLWKLLRSEGITPNLAVLPVATNDSNNSTESAALAAMLPNFYNEIEWAWPGVRSVHVEPVAAVGDKAESDVVRGIIRAAVALNPTRASIPGGQGGVHPTVALYRSGGLAIGPAYLAAA